MISAKTTVDIIFIFPSLTKSENYGHRKVKSSSNGCLPPLGLAFLAAFVSEKGYGSKIVEPVVFGLTLEDVLAEIRESNPKVICLSVVTSMYLKGIEFIKIIREQFKDKIILLGGHHATMFNKNIFADCPEIDVIICGEGELTLGELMDFFKENEYDRNKIFLKIDGLKKIDGIVFKNGDDVVVTKNRAFIDDLDVLPFPARHLLPMEKYAPLPIEYKRLPLIHMVVSRGCVFDCAFCATHAIFSHKVRFRSPQKVLEEIKHAVEVYGARQISFWDDVLTLKKEWILELCRLIVESKLDIVWNCYAHVKTVDDEILKAMKKAGCFCIWYGLETGDDELLKMLNKGMTIDDARRVVRMTKENGIEVRGLFMLGLPGETPVLAQKTIDFAKEIDCDYAQFGLFTPHSGTKLFDDAKKFGTVSGGFDQFTHHAVTFVPSGYKNAQELERMVKKAYSQFYLRPSYIFKRIIGINTFDDVKRYYDAFKMALAFT